MALFPQSKDQLRFAMSKAIARRPRTSDDDGERGEGRLICVLGPKGGTGQDAHVVQPRRRARARRPEGAGHRPRPAVRRRRALPRRSRPRRRCTTSRSPGGSLDAGQARRLRHDARDGRRRPPRARPARPGERDHDRAPARRPRHRARALRPRDRRHAAGLHRGGDRDDRRELRPRDGRDARLAVAQEHEARPRDAAASWTTTTTKIQLVLNRADTRVGISQHDVVAVLGREPDIYIPSDREIPRAVNEGVPITLSRPQSYAASAFHDLAGAVHRRQRARPPSRCAVAAASQRRRSSLVVPPQEEVSYGAPRATRHHQAGGRRAADQANRSPT